MRTTHLKNLFPMWSDVYKNSRAALFLTAKPPNRRDGEKWPDFCIPNFGGDNCGRNRFGGADKEFHLGHQVQCLIGMHRIGLGI